MSPEVWQKLKKYFGSQIELARALGVSKSLVCIWVSQKRKMSLRCALKIMEILPFHFTMKDLRPDIYLKRIDKKSTKD